MYKYRIIVQTHCVQLHSFIHSHTITCVCVCVCVCHVCVCVCVCVCVKIFVLDVTESGSRTVNTAAYMTIHNPPVVLSLLRIEKYLW